MPGLFRYPAIVNTTGCGTYPKGTCHFVRARERPGYTGIAEQHNTFLMSALQHIRWVAQKTLTHPASIHCELDLDPCHSSSKLKHREA